jgi:uncharacterized protein YbbC (DUF1343 family)
MATAIYKVILGSEHLLSSQTNLIKGKRLGIVCNQSSTTHDLRHIIDKINDLKGPTLTTLFGPQHGIRGEAQDNMVETPHTLDRKTGLKTFSLYSNTREPTEEMLRDIDTLIIDIQDVGCRVYTFIYTMANCMRAAKRHGIKVIVCDRPNPINGSEIEGNILEQELESFVGQFPIPMRHGMTIGELALLFNQHFNISCELEIIKMVGWSRGMWMDNTDAPWVMPSPNMPTSDTATAFPSSVHLEGTQLSEGRGTTRPFEIVGAPYIQAEVFAKYLNDLALPGIYFRECSFQPTFQKHSGKICEGVQLHVLDRNTFRPVITGVALIKAAITLYPEHFEWKQPPYEYVFDKLPIDVIAGTEKLRKKLEAGIELKEIAEAWKEDEQRFRELRKDFLIYR